MNIIIRPTAESDRTTVGKIYCYGWKGGYRDILPAVFLDTLTVEFCTPKKIPATTLIAENEEGVPLGVVKIGPSRDSDMPNTGELQAIYVLPEYWRMGIGEKLFARAAKELKQSGYDRFFLWVLKDNRRARAFYEKMGMKDSGDEKIQNIGGKDAAEVRYVFPFRDQSCE